MFIQVIQGKCSRPDELRALAKSWRDEDGAGSVGWLGGTYGVTDDNDFLGIVRFTSREDAMENSARPEGVKKTSSRAGWRIRKPSGSRTRRLKSSKPSRTWAMVSRIRS